MCKHCERINEVPSDRPIVHNFMQRVAEILSNKSGKKLTANDLSLKIEINLPGIRSVYAGQDVAYSNANIAIQKAIDEMHY